jgi:molecular chaperone GrpE
MSAERRPRPAGAPEDWDRDPAGRPVAAREPATDPAGADAGADQEARAGGEGNRSEAGAEQAAGSDSQQAAGTDSEQAAGSSSVQADDVSADLDRLLEDTKRERDEYLELARRARADFENYRKRAAGEAADAERRGRSDLAKSLIPSLDNLERALRAAGIDPDAAATSGDGEPVSEEVSAQQALAHGVGLVHRELREALTRAGVEAYDPAGQAFDPSWHEAVATRPADGAAPGTVLETLEKGYRLDDRVLRAAKVVVGE